MLIGRAGSGKSELIDFLKNVDQDERLEKYHIGTFEQIDDFPWIYSLFRDEDIWEELGNKRSLARRTENVYVTLDYDVYIFTVLKFNQEIQKRCEDNSAYYTKKTLFVEYARGRSDGYRKTLDTFDESILKRTAIFYMDNTFEESMRRNTVRSSDSDKEQSVLHHKTPVEVMERYYKDSDWHELTGKKSEGYIEINGIKVPFVTVWNIPESHDFKVLEERYSPPLKKLWELYSR
jgi:hypothetical protein